MPSVGTPQQNNQNNRRQTQSSQTPETRKDPLPLNGEEALFFFVFFCKLSHAARRVCVSRWQTDSCQIRRVEVSFTQRPNCGGQTLVLFHHILVNILQLHLSNDNYNSNNGNRNRNDCNSIISRSPHDMHKE